MDTLPINEEVEKKQLKQKIYETLKNKLLDTSLRNVLLNYKKTKSSSITIINEDIEVILNKIEDINDFKFIEVMDQNQDDEDTELEKSTFEENVSNIEIGAHEFLPSVSKKELTVILKKMYSKQKTLLEEQGINILFLAFGLLVWKDIATETQIKSPLLFIPVLIDQKSKKITIQNKEFLLNNSLIKKIKDDFNLNIKLELSNNFNPNNDSSLSLYELYKKYINHINHEIGLLKESKTEGWKILDDVSMSLFKFSSMDIYLDFEKNKDKIINSDLMSAIVGDNSFNSDRIFNEEEIDKTIKPENFLHCLMANSSQETAIQSAIQGSNFIIQGPPGTGKSQTITNIISELIARNKKVLFVAEKKAALDVVFKSMRSLGFADFLLFLHSNVSSKKEFITNIYTTLENWQQYQKTDEDFVLNNNLVYNYSLKNMADFIEKILSKRLPFGDSLYSLIGYYQKLANIASYIVFDINNIETINKTTLWEIQNLLSRLNLDYQAINFNIKDNLWYGLSHLNVQLQDIESIKKVASELKFALENIISFLNNKIPQNFRLLKENFNYSLFDSLWQIFNSVDGIKIDERILNIFSYKENNFAKYLNEIVCAKEETHEEFDWIIKRYNQSVFDSNIHQQLDFVLHKKKFLSRLFSRKYRNLKKSLKNHSIGAKLNYKNIVKDLKALKKLSIANNKIDDIVDRIPSVFQKEYKKIDYDTVKKYYNTFKKYEIINNELSKFSLNSEEKKEFFTFLITQDTIKESYQNAYNNLKQISTKYCYFFNNKYVDYSLSDQNIFDLTSKLNLLIQTETHPDLYTSYIEIREKVKNNQFTNNFLQVLESQSVEFLKNNDFSNLFTRRFYQLLVDYYIKRDLSNWNETEFKNNIHLFSESCMRLNQIANIKIAENVAKKIPYLNSIINNADLNLLKKEHSKSRNHISIREIFIRMPNLIQNLKPCFMMSPSSLSKHLSDSHITFDTVIFDEASQLTLENTFIAMIKAKQVIIAGDTNQLPPTNFFKTIADEQSNDEEDIEENDYDSLLERVQSIYKQITLKWHYRSRFEELILPSNQFIYNNKLITFPTPRKSNTNNSGIMLPFEGVSFIKVNGIYEEQTNEVEANEIVKLIKVLRDYYGTTKTFGIVTFNLKQANKIENKWSQFVYKNPDYMDVEIANKLFIKNIESVQGDERDIIILGITNGPDKNGRFSRNFGAINNAGGKKRLNVAITRAKDATIVISSFSYSDLKVDDLKHDGLLFLKKYLKFAEYGYDPKSDNVLENEDEKFDSEFEIQVYEELTKLGYQVKTQVGCSKFRIDLAILDKKDPTKYILGIECDGATYHSSKSARDRDAIRQSFLEQRGWNIHRIWSLNWFKNKRREIAKIIEKIDSIEKNNNSLDNLNNSNGEHYIKNMPITIFFKNKENLKFENYFSFDFVFQKLLATFPIEPQIDVISKGLLIIEEMFKYGHTFKEKEIYKMIRSIFSYLSWNQRDYSYKSITEKAMNMLKRTGKITTITNPGGEIFWHWKQYPNTFRISKNNESNRSITDICIDEFTNLVVQILTNTDNKILCYDLQTTILGILNCAKTQLNLSKLDAMLYSLINLNVIKQIIINDNSYYVIANDVSNYNL
ncbi:DUF4011 domain-containing protein [Mycoplasmopsis primatum]|uniref:DUF4011 domain-containing protein n=1 Tax=Mycoplasmopsis primatum TaxID=55604 RepID=UPI0004972757|nr:DUF4011 domain-containing protein [Mycoplasmopsis primatum]